MRSLTSTWLLALTMLTDVLQPGPTMLQRLRDRLHIQESARQGGKLCNAVCRQVPEKLGEAGRAVSGAERADGATGWNEHGQIGLAPIMLKAVVELVHCGLHCKASGLVR